MQAVLVRRVVLALGVLVVSSACRGQAGAPKQPCCDGGPRTGDDAAIVLEDDASTAPGDDDASCCDAWCCDDAAISDDAALPEDSAFPDDTAPAMDAYVDASTPVDDAGVPIGTGVCRTWASATIDVLFIGNSQIAVWDMPRIVDYLSESAPTDCTRIVGQSFVRGGANLRDLWETPQSDGTTLAGTIATGGFEVVVIAESIDLAEFTPAPFPALFVDYATRIVEASRAAGSVPILYATPYIEAPTRDGFHAMADPQLALGATLHVAVAAGGLAWLRAWDTDPTLNLYANDRQHPGPEGSYLSSLVIWSAITGGTPIGLGHSMTIYCDGGPCPPISDAHAVTFQRAAWAQQLATGASL